MRGTVSAIIPAFNEKRTIHQVVQTCLDSNILSEVTCVNDGSTDGTLEILKSFGNKITLIDFKKNMGKGSAMAEAIKKSKGDILMFIDADLMGLKPEHIELLYKTFVDKRLDSLIVSLDSPEIMFKLDSVIALSPYENGHDPLAGERIYYKKDLLPHAKKIASLGYGVEVYLNNIYKNKELGFLKLSGVTQLFKYHKKGWSRETIVGYLKEFREITRVLAEQRIASKIGHYKKRLVKFRKKLKREIGSIQNGGS